MDSPLQAYRLETTLTENGTVTLHSLPFQAGETVEIIVLSTHSAHPDDVEYSDPLEPVAELDWEAI